MRKNVKYRTYITKSRAGHYTATVRDAASGELIRMRDKLPSLEAARKAARDIISVLGAYDDC